VATLACVGLLHLNAYSVGDTQYVMGRMLVIDPLGHVLAFFACLAMLVTLVYAQVYSSSRDLLKGELFTLALFALLGISIMVAGNNFLVIYMGLELMSLSLYALTALRRDSATATEAAMKYFVLGALASGFLLYGLSMMYGATGSLDIPRVFEVLQSGQPNKQVIAFGLAFIVAGLAFKFGAVPFHMWVPDVYHGAPSAITLMIAGAPKLAAFGMAFRLLVEGMSSQAGDWQQMLMVLSVCSLVIGNLVAIAQTNLKRMLAYSTISQIGFMLLGFTPTVIAANTNSAVNGYSSAMFYLVSYVLTTLGSFGLIMLLARPGFEAEEINDLAGLNQRAPAMALIMAVFMFSLAGVPPVVGFYAKLAVLQSLVATGESVYIWLAVFAVMMSLIGAFYYLRIVKVMYFDKATDTQPLVQAPGANALLSVNGLAVLVLGIFPGGLMAMCSQAVLKALAT
jgi:NADH-quinone oxidoreductase subunit N